MSYKQYGPFTNLLTIAIPVFERKDYFQETLESALNQTIRCEVLVVDNCSSHDFFEKVCKEKEVTYIRNEYNIGLFPNLNKCYTLAKTEYVKILDDDDLLSPSYVESFLKAKELHPNIDVFFSDYVLLREQGELSHPYILPFGYMENGNKIIEYAIKNRLGFPYMTSIIKKTRAQLDLDLNVCVGGYDWVWVYSNANQLSFYGESGKYHKYRIHDNKASDKYRLFNLLTVPYIYDIVFPRIISDLKLRKKISKKAFWELIRLKLHGKNKDFREISNSDNRFGRYLKVKLNEDYLLKTIYMLPQIVLRLVVLPIKLFNRFWRQSQN